MHEPHVMRRYRHPPEETVHVAADAWRARAVAGRVGGGHHDAMSHLLGELGRDHECDGDGRPGAVHDDGEPGLQLFDHERAGHH